MVSNFFIAANFYSLMAVSASYAISKLGVNETKAGLGAGIFVIGAMLARVVFSRYAIGLDMKKTLLISIGALIVCTALLFVAKGFLIFCVIRFLGGLTFGVNNNTLMTAVTYIIPSERKGEGVGWFYMSQVLGMALGPFFAVSFMHLYGFNTVFFFETLTTIIAFIAIVFVKQPQVMKDGVSASADGAAYDSALLPPEERGVWRSFERSAIKIAILCTILSICNTVYMSFAAIFVSGAGAPAISSAIFLASAGSMVVSRPIIGKTFDKHGPNAILIFGFLIFAAGLFLLGQGITSAFLLAALMIGLGVSSWQGASLSIVVTEAPRHRLHVANSTYFLALDLGAAIGPIVGGQTVEHVGYGSMYVIFAAVAIICMPLYFFVLAKRRNGNIPVA